MSATKTGRTGTDRAPEAPALRRRIPAPGRDRRVILSSSDLESLEVTFHG